ncbi:MAG: hypothetical protein ACPGVG_10435 [Mycobacterium sp.]
MAQREPAEWVDLAKGRVVEVLTEQHSVVTAELIARISEAGFRRSEVINIDPTHVMTAAKELTEEGVTTWASEPTRGKRVVKTLQLADQRRTATVTARAAARKRLLWTRYLSWAEGSARYPHGLIGPAGEAAARSAITESGIVIPLDPTRPQEVKTVLGVRVAGPLDSAGLIVPIEHGTALGNPVVVLFEVKNLREWIYPHNEQLYQLLAKAVHVQRERPDTALVPVFIARRTHFTLYRMAKQFGFLVIETARQFIGEVEETEMLEVRNGLQLHDLAVGSGPSLRVRDRLRGPIAKQVPISAPIWKQTALGREGTLLEAARVATNDERDDLLNQLRHLRGGGGW